MIRRYAAAAAVLAIAVSSVAQANVHLTTVGPVSPSNGFPQWYRDDTGTLLELCLDPNNPLCGALAVPNPAAPVVFPTNFPDEAFYMLAQATMPTNGGGQATLVLGLEAAFANGAVVPGDQIVFGRIRIRIDNLTPGATYTVTHPYGVDTFTNVAGGTRGVNFTEDIGIGAPGNFTLALQSRIGPFLKWPTGAPAGFIGDPAVPHVVTGSPNGTDVFRIEGPNVGGAGVNVVQTTLFTLQGKVSAGTGVEARRVTYSRSAAGLTGLDVFGFAAPGKQINASGTGFTTFALVGNAAGDYFGHASFNGAPPATITVTNASDVPPTVLSGLPVKDLVTITQASYDPATQSLTIAAASSDAFAPPTLQFGLLSVVGGSLVVPNVTVPPPSVTITSSRGGSATTLVTVGNTVAPPPPPPPTGVVANAGPDQTVRRGALVTLNGTASTGATSFAWVQTAGPVVTLTGASTAQPTFTMPLTTTPLVFRLTATGTGGATSTDTVQISMAVDTLGTNQVEFRTNAREWRIAGTASLVGPGNTVTVHLGSTLAGPVLGTAAVDALGVWTLRVRNGPNPPATNTISIESTLGGVRLAIPVTVRN